MRILKWTCSGGIVHLWKPQFTGERGSRVTGRGYWVVGPHDMRLLYRQETSNYNIPQSWLRFRVTNNVRCLECTGVLGWDIGIRLLENRPSVWTWHEWERGSGSLRICYLLWIRWGMRAQSYRTFMATLSPQKAHLIWREHSWACYALLQWTGLPFMCNSKRT